MLIRFEKYSLYFLQQLGKAILCCLLPWGSLRKQYENDFFSLQQAYLMLAGKHRNKGKVEAFVFYTLY